MKKLNRTQLRKLLLKEVYDMSGMDPVKLIGEIETATNMLRGMIKVDPDNPGSYTYADSDPQRRAIAERFREIAAAAAMALTLFDDEEKIRSGQF